MSFDINPNRNVSNVQASSKTTDGGGGNTGYFQRGKTKEEEAFEFKKETPEDSFEKITLEDLEEETNEPSFLEKIFNWLKKILKQH